MNKTLKSKNMPRKVTKKDSASKNNDLAHGADLVLGRTKNSWDSKVARQAAILTFCLELHKDGAQGAKRTACKDNEQFAKNFFASIGGFYHEGEEQEDPQHPLPFIPTNTVFRVFENRKDETDWLVTIVLPAADQAFPDPFVPNNFWRCTWVPY
ncbi:MAG TPA: hypothetical protein VNP98_08875 [Chthoniobacterales bacterium]|nr:hypothetical protein [Chthoniobacterales bacterium]